MKVTSRALSIFVIASLILAASSWVSAQEDFSRTARKKLLEAARPFTNQGYRLMGEPYISHLGQEATERIDIQTTRGASSYVVVSVCDEYCTDIDLALVKGDGETIEAGRKDRSIVTVTPRTTAPINLRLTMTGCSEEPCYYGLGVFVK